MRYDKRRFIYKVLELKALQENIKLEEAARILDRTHSGTLDQWVAAEKKRLGRTRKKRNPDLHEPAPLEIGRPVRRQPVVPQRVQLRQAEERIQRIAVRTATTTTRAPSNHSGRGRGRGRTNWPAPDGSWVRRLSPHQLQQHRNNQAIMAPAGATAPWLNESGYRNTARDAQNEMDHHDEPAC